MAERRAASQEFAPVAVIGRGCVLPGALSVGELWQAVRAGASLIGPTPQGRFGLTLEEEAVASRIGGYVSGFAGPVADGQDAGEAWLLEAARQAWAEAGAPQVAPERLGVIVGALGYPSRGLCDLAAEVWEGETVRARERRLAGSGPALAVARAFGARGCVLALDAACASSLYAIKLACDRLQDGRLDAVIVGGVNAVDALMLQQGFAALKAVSPTGRSRPFMAGADGLIPSEGAACVVLTRLGDRLAGGRVFGVVTGVGLSNDGARKGLLVPDAEGQGEAMARAWALSGRDPARALGLLEAHATGTGVGDGVEVQASAALVAGGSGAVRLGSLKGNTGHLITAAGLASVIKVACAFEAGEVPPHRVEGEPLGALADTRLRLQREPERWPEGLPVCAAVSNFGFGGNNAHLILEPPEAVTVALRGIRLRRARTGLTPLAVVGLGLRAGPVQGVVAVDEAVRAGQGLGPDEMLTGDAKGMRTPPADMAGATAAQLAVFAVVEEALGNLAGLGVAVPAGERVGCYVGFAVSAESARWMWRERLSARLGLGQAERDAVAAPLSAADVTGAMPNLTANRLMAARDWRAQGFAVMAEGESGRMALALAADALRAGEIDMAVVAAADYAAEAVDRAVGVRLATGTAAGDGAGALLLMREADVPAGAVRGRIAGPVPEGPREGEPVGLAEMTRVAGCAPVACALMGAVLSLWRARCGQAGEAEVEALSVIGLDGVRGPVAREAGGVPWFLSFAGESAGELADAVAAGRPGFAGAYRLALVSAEADGLISRAQAAVQALRGGAAPSGEGVHYGVGEAAGELAFVFTGAAAAQSGAGRALALAWPEVADPWHDGFAYARAGREAIAREAMNAHEQLQASVYTGQLQHRVLTRALGLKPKAALGLSSGETQALMAFGAWGEPDGLMADIAASGMYERDLGGEHRVAQAHFGRTVAGWESWLVLSPRVQVEAALAGRDDVFLTIVYGPRTLMVSGLPEACAAVLSRFPARLRVAHDLMVHTPALAPYADTWRALHTRATRTVPGVRFYGNAVAGAYVVTAQACAQMLTEQALGTVDFPATVRQAWQDGVRTFVEIGPRRTLTDAITDTLKGAPGVRALATHGHRAGELHALAELVGALFAAGHGPDVEAFAARMQTLRAGAPRGRPEPKAPVRVPAHVSLPRFAVRRTAPETHETLETPCRKSPMTEPVTPKTQAPASWPRIPLPLPPERPGVSYEGRAAAPVAVEARAQTLREAPQGRVTLSPQRPARAVVALPPARVPVPLRVRAPEGQAVSREELEAAAFGPVSALFGAEFIAQDSHTRQVRNPRPPLLLCDRVTGIAGEKGKARIGKGVIWTETDVTPDHWAVHDGFMRLGPMVEAGQADLMLMSWMGVDLTHGGERIYRLLGCELTFHPGGMPQPGDTLRFQIEITGSSELNGVRMFFIAYDCWCNDRMLLSVRSGQAGFFTDAELAEAKGVLWDAESADPPTPNWRAPAGLLRPSVKRAFGAAEVAAFRAGDAWGCFGEGFEGCASHHRPVRLPQGRLALFDEVEVFEPGGGPWGRGYLRARQRVTRDAWFYDGHFHNDPCMPGTLMVEAAVQALSFLAAALGLTVERDSHVFEPEAGRPAQFICRGQVIPNTDHEVIYEVFVDEILGGATPVIRAALLASSDGLKVFYCPVFSLRLRPHWPQLAGPQAVARIVGPSGDVRGDERALMEMASGAPSRALGSMYAGFDGGGRLPRLPSPPYHMVSRIVDVDAPPGLQAAGLTAKAQYDVPPTAWYFDDAPGGVMPLSVLSEVALQPCGWLAGYAGLALSGDSFFRNLDGKGVVHAEVGRDAGRLDVTTTLKQVSRAGPLTLVFYDVEVTDAAGRAVMSLATSFGFFTATALASQAGLKTDGALREAVALEGAGLDVPDGGGLALPSGRLRMIDRVERVEAEGGPAGLGRIVCAQDVDPRAWYFRAHFFADPVQPGSLGLEALVEALTRLIKAKGLDAGFARPVVQALAMGEAVGWTYRGQVTPGAGKVTTLVDLLAVEREGDGGLLLRARGHLFVDGLRIYQMEPFAVRVREGATEPVWTGRVAARDTPWLESHRPTHTLPALPLMAMAGMALRAGGKVGTGVTLTDFAPTAWAVVPEGGMALLARVEDDGAVNLTGRSGVPEDVAGTRLAAGRIVRGEVPALTLKGMRTTGMAPLGDLYGSAQLFHGPALHMVTGGKRGPKGFALEVDLARASVPGDPFDPAILDALVHGVPHQSAEDWFDVPDGMVIYPVRVVALSILGGLPKSGVLQVRGRPLPGARPPHHLPIRIEAWSAQGPYAVLELIEKAYPKGRFGELDLKARRAFIRGEQAEPFAVLSRVDAANGDTLLAPMDVTACDWLPGSVAQTYGTGALSGTALVRAVALKEHFARLWRVHPRKVVVDEVFAEAPGRGRVRYTIAFDREERAWRVKVV